MAKGLRALAGVFNETLEDCFEGIDVLNETYSAKIVEKSCMGEIALKTSLMDAKAKKRAAPVE